MPAAWTAVASAALATLLVGGGAAPASKAPTPDPLAGLVVIAPLITPVDDSPYLTAGDLAADTAPTGLLTRELDAYLAAPVTIGVDPRIVASIVALGDAAPDTATDFLHRLTSAPNATFLLGYGDADPEVLATTRGTRLLQLDSSVFTPTVGGVVWPAAGTLTADALDPLARAGYTTVVLDSADLSGAATTWVSLPSKLHAVVADDAASTALDAVAAGTADPSTLAGHLHPGTVLTLSRDAALALGSVTALADGLADARLSILPLSAAMSGTPEAAHLAAPHPQPGRASALASLVGASFSVQQFAGILGDPVGTTDTWQRTMLALCAASTDTANPTWQQAAAKFRSDAGDLTSSVGLEEGSNLLVLGSSTSLPVSIGNSLDEPVTVVVSVRPTRPLLRVQNSPIKVTIAAQSTSKVVFTVDAVTNGQVPMQVSVASPSGAQIGAVENVQVDVQAQWETVFVIVGVLLVLLFVAGLIRNLVLRRRRSRTESAT